jgi:hypothetical protein
MTSTSPNPGPDAFEIRFRDDATEPDRLNAERSVAALLARSREAVAKARAAETEMTKLIDALHDPFMQLVQKDPRALEALESIRTRPLMPVEKLDALGQDAPALTYDTSPSGLSGIPISRSLDFIPPYDFAWAWHDGNPAFNQVLERPGGRVGLDARTGTVSGGAPGFVNAHAGFGVFLRSDAQGQRFPHAVLNPGRYSFSLGTNGVGSNATSEGGFELTVFEEGRLLAAASRTLWRSRVSGTLLDPTESASGSQGPQPMTGPELAFTIRPGLGYTFNAGIWVFSDRSAGIGVAGVQSVLQGVISRMWVFG